MLDYKVGKLISKPDTSMEDLLLDTLSIDLIAIIKRRSGEEYNISHFGEVRIPGEGRVYMN